MLKIANVRPIFKKEDSLDKTKHTANCFKNFRKNIIQSVTTFFKKTFFASALWIQKRVQYSICLDKPSPKMAKVFECVWGNCRNLINGLIKSL